MIETVRNDTERQRLDLGRRFRRTLAIRQYAWQFKDFGGPAAILFLLDFHREGHRDPPLLPAPIILCFALRRGQSPRQSHLLMALTRARKPERHKRRRPAASALRVLRQASSK